MVAVKPSSPAARKGLHRGDVILEVAGVAVDDPQAFAAAIDQSIEEGDARVLLLVKSGNRQRFVAVPETNPYLPSELRLNVLVCNWLASNSNTECWLATFQNLISPDAFSIALALVAHVLPSALILV